MTRVGIEEQIQTDDGRKVSSHKKVPKSSRVTSMLTNVGKGVLMTKNVGDGFFQFCQNLLYFNVGIGNQHSKDAINIEKFTKNDRSTSLSPTSMNTNIRVTSFRKFESYF